MPSNDASQEQDGPNDTVRYQPLPSIYRAFASGASGSQAIAETVDNSIDHVRSRVEEGHNPPERLQVTISYWPAGEWDDDEDVIVIQDNAGGVLPDELGKFFQLGRSETPSHSIGRFGVGAKRLIAVGNEISYQSRADGSDQGWAFDVDAAEFQTNTSEVDEEIYESERYEVDLEEGCTQIVIRDLKTEWEDLLGTEEIDDIDDPKEISGDGTLLDFDGLYENFLRDGIDIGLEGTIEFVLKLEDPSGEHKIQPPERISFSHLPFDGLNPRTYTEIPFDSVDEYTGEEETLRVDITVGLMLSSRPDDAGLTVSMNNRNVLFRDTDNDLFSSSYLGKFRTARGHGRLVCQIDIRGSSRAMPWNDLKTGLDPTMGVTDDLLRVAENALTEYRRQEYEALPEWMLSAYPETEMHAANGGEIEAVDKSSSKKNNPRFNTKPGKGIRGRSARRYPERDRLIGIVRLHRDLRIIDEESTKPYEKPAYFKYFEDTSNSEYEPDDEYTPDSPTNITGPNEDVLPIPEGIQVELYEGPLQMYANLDYDRNLPVISEIKALVSDHTDQRVRATDETEGFNEWRLPRYEEEMKRRLNRVDLSGLEVLDELAEEAEPEQEETTVESDSTEDGSDTSPPSREKPDSKESPRPKQEQDSERDSTRETTVASRDASTTSSDSSESANNNAQSRLGQSQQDTTRETKSDTNTAKSTSSYDERETSVTHDPEQSGLVIRVPEEKREAFCRGLGLTENAEQEEVENRVVDLLTGEVPEEAIAEIGDEDGPLLIGGLSEDEREELYRVLELDSEASPEEVGERLLDVIERYQRIRSMIS
jgi:hypothetical protein